MTYASRAIACLRALRPLTALTAVAGLALAAALAAAPARAMEVVSEQTATGFKFPESVACDAQRDVLYVSQFGSALKPTQKDGAGYISKVGLDGKVMEQKFLPAAGVTLNKPKGIWVQGNRLWVTDIDSVWEFDLDSHKGRRVELPGIKFANDPTIVDGTLYVSDNRGDQLYSVKPADFLDGGEPEVAVVFSGNRVNPNGLYPGHGGSVLMVGFKSGREPRGIFTLTPGGQPHALSRPIGMLDGIYRMDDGTLLVSDWVSGTLFAWSPKSGQQTLAKGFKGPADLCAMPHDGGLLVVVPDLVKSELRIVQLKP